MSRSSRVERNTRETSVTVELDLDGDGGARLATGVGFFDHMLTLFAYHARLNLAIDAQGDLHVDPHHTVEDVGITLGAAVRESLGDRRGITRYGSATLPMDETLVTSAFDLGGRSCLVWRVELPSTKLGGFDTELAEEFWTGFAREARCNAHFVLHHGKNTHHILEACFKAAGRALRMAFAKDAAFGDAPPSTKGSL